MSKLLDVVPKNQCDADGVPLDWERCRTCNGEGRTRCSLCGSVDCGCVLGRPLDQLGGSCTTCGGYGSLKAAVLAYFSLSLPRNANKHFPKGPEGESGFKWGDPEWRCEGCGHPMSEGMWERGTWPRLPTNLIPGSIEWALEHLRRGHEPPRKISSSPSVTDTFDIFYSSCDKECNHGGPGRSDVGPIELVWYEVDDVKFVDGPTIQASWRYVDIFFRNGWAHDLRAENLVLLCTRCAAKNLSAP